MAELLVEATNETHADPQLERQTCRKAGYCLLVRPDGWNWGKEERPPKFYVIKLPGVSVHHPRIVEYVSTWMDEYIPSQIYQRRRWRLRVDDIPVALRNRLDSAGSITIAVGGYAGEYDVTWAQLRGYMRDLKTGTDETGDLNA